MDASLIIFKALIYSVAPAGSNEAKFRLKHPLYGILFFIAAILKMEMYIA